MKKEIQVNGFIAGIDEAGRGPLAGPVVAAAVILPEEDLLGIGINDSKKLTKKRREELYYLLKGKSLTFGVGIVDNTEIDEINILQATLKAMRNAVETLTVKPDFLLVDGNYFKDFGIPHKKIVKGDSKSISVASASIIAKVVRDGWMIEVADRLYPEFGFAKHKGYGTKEHYRAIEKHGLCPLHRRSFLKKLL